MSRLPVLAAALLALAALLLSGQTAQAQTTVWSATLTVDKSSSYSGCSNASFSAGNWDNCSSSTVLSDDDFVYNGTTYTITGILRADGTLDTLRIRFTSAAGTTKTALSALTLNVGSSAFAISDATVTAWVGTPHWLSWSNKPSWSDNDSVSLSLTAPATDTTAPTVTAASTGYFSNAAATTALTAPQKAGASIYTKVTFSEDMKHTKSDGASARPALSYRIGSTDTRYDILDNGDTLASGDCKPNHATDTNVYVCRYTVGSSDNGAFKVKAGTNSVDKADNALASAYTHAASVTLDTTAPTITGFTMFSTAQTYGTGDDIAVTANFSETVTVTGTPTLAIAVGSNSRTAEYSTGGSFSTGKPFYYTVQSGDEDTDGISIAAGSITLAGGATIKDDAGNAATLTHSGLAQQSAHKVDTARPAKPSGFSATAGDGRAVLSWTNPSDSTITKWQYRRKPKSSSESGYTDWTEISGSDASTTSYTVTGLTNGTLYTFQIRAVDAGGAGTASDEKTVTPVAPTGPTVTGSPAITSSVPSGQDGKYKIGDDIEATVTFGAAIAVTGTPKLAITVGSAAKSADCAAHGSDNTKLVCTYTVASGDEDTMGIGIGSNQLTTPSGATIKNSGGTADANLNHSALAQQSGHKVDGVRPTVTGFEMSSPAGTFGTGDNIFVHAVFSETVTVTGSPTLAIAVGSNSRTATYTTSFSEFTKKSFAYNVQSGDADTDGISIAAGSITLAGGATVKDAAGNAATLTHSGLTTQSAHKVDTARPAKPAGFSATAGDQQATLSWTNPSDSTITKWQYRQKTSGNYGSWQDFTSSATTTSHTVSSLTNGTAYTFQIRAVDAVGAGTASDEKTATPAATVPAIGGLTAVAGPMQVTLSWTNPASCTAVSPVCGYQYRYRPAGGAWTTWAFLTTSSLTTHTVTGLNNGTRYEFEVRRRQTGNTLAQSAVSATPGAAVPAIDGLTAVAGPEKVTLSWPNPASCTAHAHPVCKYRTRYRASGDAWPRWRETVGPRVFGALTAGTEYEFQVRREELGTILAQSTVKATPLPGVVVTALEAPEGLFGNPHRDTDAITLNWRRPAAPADAPVTGYVLQVSANAAGPWTVLATITDSTSSGSHAHRNVGAGTTRWYRVRAVNSAGEGPWSGVVSASTYAANAPAAPTGVAAAGISGGVRLSWNATTDATVTGWEYRRWQGAVYGPWTAVPGGAATVRHDVTGLQPGMRHSFQIRAVAGTVKGKWSAAVGAEPNMRPTGLVVEPGPGSVTLSWDDPGDDAITGWEYQQRVRQLAWGPWTAVPGGAGTTSFTVRGLVGDSYDFKVRAAYPDGVRGPESAQTTARAEAVREGAPTDVATGFAAQAGNARVLLTWDNPGRRQMAFWEFRTKAGNADWGDWEAAGAAVDDPDGHVRLDPAYRVVDGLTNGTPHRFQVRAVNSAGPGPGSAVAMATPLASIEPVVVTPGSDRLKVDWSGGMVRAWGYTVEWRSGSEEYGAEERTLEFHGDDTEGEITGLAPGTAYGVRVSYWDLQHGTSRTLPIIAPCIHRGDRNKPDYDSEECAEVRATTLGPSAAPAQVTGMRATSGDGSLGVSWGAVLGADGYEMEWREAAGTYGGERRELLRGERSTGHTLYGLSMGAEYAVRVTATREGAPAGTPSEEVLARIAGVSAEPGRNALRVTWTRARKTTGHALAGYLLEWAPAGEAYDESRRLSVDANTTRYELIGLDGGVEHKVRVTWSPGPDAEGERVGEARATPSGEANVSPVLSRAWARDDAVTLEYDRDLDPDPAPAKNAFKVRAATVLLDVVDVSVAGSEVRLGLAKTVDADDALTVDYTPPARSDGRIRSTAGHAAAGLSNRAVENGTPRPLPALSVADAEAVAEGAALSFAVTLSAAASGPVAVDWATADGTATAGEDYEGATGALTFAAGETAQTVTVASLADAAEEETETLTLVLSDPSGAVLGDAEASGSITDVAPVRQLESLTAAFEDVPSEHGGKGQAFTVRVAFGAPVTVGATKAVREGTVAVAGGRVTRSTRVDFRLDLWEFDIEPDSHEAVTVTVAAAADCAAPGAICTADGRALASALVLTAIGPAPLTAAFEDAPSEHGGEGQAFTVRVAFSAPVTVGATKAVREGTVAVAGGRVTRSTRVDFRLDLWEFDIEPGSHEAVTVTVAASADCAAPGAICTADGRALAPALVLTAIGPAVLDVADARGEEEVGATIDFALTLSRAASGPVTVAYATRDDTAKAGEDYTAASGRLTFAAGETAKTVSVTVLDDAHDEGEERFTLQLSNATGAQVGDGEAVGTIENGDPLPQAWLARFGRTASDHALEAIGARLDGAGTGGNQMTFGGARLFGGPAGTDDSALPGWNPGTGPGAYGTEPWATGGAYAHDAGPAMHGSGMYGALSGGAPGMTGFTSETERTLRDALLGSSFLASVGGTDGDGSPRLAAWGNVAASTFDGDADGVALDGEVTTMLAGVDAEWGRWLAGLALARSHGTGGYGAGERGDGRLDSALTTVNPYLRFAVNDRLSAWGAVGFGGGKLTLEDAASDAAWDADTAMRMAAAGARGVFARTAGGLELAGRVDARLVRTASDAVSNGFGNLAASAAETNRLRVVLEGSQAFAFGAGRTLTPTLEIGLRRDGGDAETGAGFEFGGTLRYADADLGLSAEAAGRVLAAHEDAAYREWGASLSVRIDPKTPGRGLALTLAPSWGASATGGAERLWSLRDARGLGGYAGDAGMRLATDIGYGLSAFRGRGTMMPYAGMASAGGDARDWRAGVRWTRGPALEFAFEATRRVDVGERPLHGLMLRIEWRPGAAAAPSHGAGERPAPAP